MGQGGAQGSSSIRNKNEKGWRKFGEGTGELVSYQSTGVRTAGGSDATKET